MKGKCLKSINELCNRYLLDLPEVVWGHFLDVFETVNMAPVGRPWSFCLHDQALAASQRRFHAVEGELADARREGGQVESSSGRDNIFIVY